MSKAIRRKHDAYFTPKSATWHLVNYLGLSLGGAVLEPCAGEGAIARILSDMGMSVLTNDIADYDVDYHADATNRLHWELFARQSHVSFHRSIDWVVSNPPFNVAPQIIPLAYEFAHKGIAMLLRGSFTEPCFDRQDWLAQHADHLAHIIYLPRISFTNNGKSDNMSCNWYVWTKEAAQGCQLHWVLKEKRGRAS